MKNFRKVLMVLMVALLSLSIFACNVDNTDDSNDNGQSNTPNTPDQSVIDVTDMQVVCNADLGDKVYSELYSSLTNKMGSVVLVVPDTMAAKGCEIVIGETNREISKKAYLYLSRTNKSNSEDVTYLIYSDGNSVAIAYEEDKYGLNASANFAVDYFIENLLSTFGDVKLEKGTVTSGSLDPVIYQDAIDEQLLDNAWLKLEAEAGKEVVEATKEYYSMYSDRLISWLADLYDPETGAFYFCNSGRNTEGYLPDIEATFHVLSMIENSGMIDHLGRSFTNLPDWFLEKMARWVKSLQDPNGYFYHPQWGKEITDTKPNRRGRDLNYGSAIMAAGGITHTYDTPNGTKGDYTLNDGTKVDQFGNPVAESTSALSHRLGISVAAAVSKVVPTAEVYSPQLKDAASFKAYLYSLDLRNNSYSVGNMLSNQVGEIKQRDRELGGALVRILEAWLIEFQNPANGMWEWRSESDPTYSDYDGVNGILKLLTLFNNLGIEYPNPVPAMESIVKSIYTEDSPPSVCQPYNAWYAMEDMFKNLRAHTKNSAETEKLISSMVERLRADAVNLINHTANKVAIFIKEDTTSSFAPKESSATSQGMRVAVPHTNEGDTNATSINTFGTLNHMFKVLGWSKPSMFGKGDYYRFMYMIENQSPVIKHKMPAPDPLDFENDDVNSLPLAFDLSKCNSTGEKCVVADPTGAKKGNVYKFETTPGGHDSLGIICDNEDLTASCYIFQSDIYLSTAGQGYFTRFYIDESYFLGLIVDGDKIHFIDASSQGNNRREQSLLFTANLEEWFNLRIEYYAGDIDTVRAKIYLNGECVAVSDNFWDSKGYGVPFSFYAKAKIEGFTGASFTYYLDNVLVNKTNDVYKEETDPSIKINVDGLDKEAILYDFNEGTVPEDITVSGASESVSVKGSTDDKHLNIAGSAAATFHVPLTKRTAGSNVYIFDSYVTLNSIDENSKFEILFNDAGIMNTSVMRLWIVGVSEGGETYGVLYEASGGLLGAIIPGIKFTVGEEIRFTVEYYEDENAALIYANGKLVGFSSAVEAYAKRTFAGKVMLKNVSGNVDISFDDITAEINVKSFEQAVKPENDSITHRFEDGLKEGATLSGGEIVVRDGANKVVSFKGGATLTVPNNKRSVATGAFVFKSTFNIPTNAAAGESFDLIFTATDGNTILRYNVKVGDNSAGIYEITANNTYTNAIAEIPLGSDVAVTIEYYAKKEVAHIYFGEVCYAVTSITYSEGSGKLEPASVTIKSDSAALEFTVDNVVMESYDKFYAHQTAKGQNSESNANKLTFETSTTGNLPLRFTTDLRTASAAIRIKEMMRGDKASKVMEFETSAGANDKIYFTALNDGTTGKKVTVSESAISFDMNGGGATYELYLTNAAGNHSYLLVLAHSGSTLSINDLTGNSSANVPGRIFGTTVKIDGIDEREWFNLKIEYYEGDHDSVRIMTYVNNKLVYVSKGYYGRSTTTYGTQPSNSIDRVMISSYGAVVGRMYLDDMSIYKSNKTLTDAALTYVPKEAEQVLPNDEDGVEILTFESSKTGNLPAPITKELLSSGGALTVKSTLRAGKSSKVMALTTTAGSGDKLFFAKTKKLEGYNALEFSTKIKFEDYETTGVSFYVYHREGSSAITRLVFSIGKDGSLVLNDYFNGTYSIADTKVPSFSAGDWHDLKLTLYSYNGFSRLIIKIDNNEYISKNTGWSTLTPQRISSLRIDTSTATDATILFDDVSLREVKIDIPAEHEHTYETAWTTDDVYHYHKSTCSDNAECAIAVSDKAEHSFGDGTVCVCGYEKIVIGGGSTLGYFDTLGGFDYEDTAGNHWKWSSKNAAKIIRNSGWTSGDQWTVANTTPNYAKNYLNFLKIADNYIAELGKGTATTVTSQIYFVSQGGSGNLFVYETDICLNSCAALLDAEDATYMTIGFTGTAAGSDGAICGIVKLTAVKEGDSVIGYKLFDTTLSADTWYNIAAEYSAEAGTATYYVDGEKVGIVRMTNAPTDVGYFAITVSENADGAVVRFDNTYLGFVAESLAKDDNTVVPEISEAHAVHTHTYDEAWTYNDEKHWHKASCSDNSECATAVSEETAHSLDADGKCACGYEEGAEPEPEKGELGYFATYGGYDFAAITGTSDFEKSGTFKRLNGYMNCENRGASAVKMYFGVFNVGENTGIEIGTNDGKWGSSGGPMIGCYFDDTVADRYVFESDVYFSDCFVTGSNFNALRIAFCGADGTEYTARSINAVAKDGGGYAYDVYGVTVEKETWVNIGVIYSPKEGTVKYYTNGILMITDTVDTTENAMNYVKLGGSEYGGSYVRFDNLYYGKQNAHLTESDEYYTFNDGEIPAGITLENKSGAATLGAADVMTDKALELHTETGGEDRVWFTLDQLDGANKIVFETKYLVKPGVDGNQVFEYMNGTTVVGYVLLSMSSNGTIQISDYFSGTKTHSFSTVSINLGTVQWVDIKLETYEDGGLCTDIYINGAKVATSKNTAWENSKISDVNGMRYRTFSALVGNVYFDDLKFQKIKE